MRYKYWILLMLELYCDLKTGLGPCPRITRMVTAIVFLSITQATLEV